MRPSRAHFLGRFPSPDSGPHLAPANWPQRQNVSTVGVTRDEHVLGTAFRAQMSRPRLLEFLYFPCGVIARAALDALAARQRR